MINQKLLGSTRKTGSLAATSFDLGFGCEGRWRLLMLEGRWRMLLSEGRWREGAVATELGWLDAGSRRSGDRRIEAFVRVFIYESCLVTN